MNSDIGGRAYLIKKLGERGLSRRRSLRVLNHIFREIRRALARGEEVEFAGGRLVVTERDGVRGYLGADYPANWDYWTVEWVPDWKTLKRLVGREAAEEQACFFFLDNVFFNEWHEEHRGERGHLATESRRARAEWRAYRRQLGKLRKRRSLPGK